MAAATFYLYLNGYEATFTNKEYEDFMVAVVNAKPSIKIIAEWLQDHSTELDG